MPTIRRLPLAWRLAAIGCAAVLAACSGVPTAPQAPQGPQQPQAPAPRSAPPAASTPSAEQRAAAPAALAAERKWLQALFAGTPVRIAQTRDGPVAVDVPREFCFDPGDSRIKPPLAAVLDKVSTSLQRVPAARVTLLAAPGDAAANAALVRQRAAALHKRLLAGGVAAGRIVDPSATALAAVQLRIEAVAPAP